MFEEIKEFIYTPINYRDWIVGDEARSGINIKKLKILTSEEHKILEEAIPFAANFLSFLFLITKDSICLESKGSLDSKITCKISTTISLESPG